MDSFLILSLFLILILCCLAYGVLRWGFIWRRTLRQKFEKIATSINGRVKTSFFGLPEIQVERQGIPFRIKYISRGKYYPAEIKVEILKEPPFKLSLSEEDFNTKISKKIGLAREAQIGIADFDEEFFIQTNDSLRCQNYLSTHKTRETIKNIYDKGWNLRFTKKRIELTQYLEGGPYSTQIKEEEITGFFKGKDIDSLIKSLAEYW